jgi:hypothetical protein
MVGEEIRRKTRDRREARRGEITGQVMMNSEAGPGQVTN